MKKKNIIICSIAAIVLAGASVAVAYTLDRADTVAPDAPIEEQLEAAEKAEQKLRSKADIIAREMSGNGNFSEEAIQSMKNQKLNPNTLYDFRDMNEEQMKEYVKRAGQVSPHKRGVGLGFLRIRAEVLGKMSVDAPRLSVEALDELVKESHSRTELYDNIRNRYGEPDFTYSNEAAATILEYWLDDEGLDYLLVYAPGSRMVTQIGLLHYNAENGGTEEGEQLYSIEDLKALYGEGK